MGLFGGCVVGGSSADLNMFFVLAWFEICLFCWVDLFVVDVLGWMFHGLIFVGWIC